MGKCEKYFFYYNGAHFLAIINNLTSLSIHFLPYGMLLTNLFLELPNFPQVDHRCERKQLLNLSKDEKNVFFFNETLIYVNASSHGSPVFSKLSSNH